MRRITYWLSLLLIFSIPWEDSLSTDFIGSVTRVIGLVLAVCWIGTIIIEGRFRKLHLFHALALLFFSWNAISLFWSSDSASTFQRVATYAQMFLLMLIIWEIFRKPQELAAGLQAYVFGSYVLVINTIYNFVIGNVAVLYEGRYSASGVNAVDLALILLLGLPIAMRLFLIQVQNNDGNILKSINLLYTPLAIFASLLTGSRTYLIAIVPFCIFLVTTQQINFNRKILFFSTMLILLLVLLPFIPQTVIDRLGTIGTSISTGDLDGRVELWKESIALLAQHPFLGLGGGALDSLIGSAAHNTFVSVVTETGFIGFILFLSILQVVIYQVIKLPKDASGIWLAIFLTWAIGVLSLSWEFRKVTWLILSFVIAEGGLIEQLHLRKVPPDSVNGIESSPVIEKSSTKPDVI